MLFLAKDIQIAFLDNTPYIVATTLFMVIFGHCFRGLTIQADLSNKDYIFIKHANRTDSYRIFARYNTTTSSSNTFRQDYGNLLGIDLNGNEWRWHHVVTGDHIRQLFTKSIADNLYNNQIPTVLIHQTTEHIDYNLLHAHGVKAVFDLPQNNQVLTGTVRTNFIATLKTLYARVYAHDQVLKTVAANILMQL